jgi:hypothetical protein
VRKYVADFETTVEPDQTRVWMWGHTEIGNVENFHYGTNIESFIAWCRSGGCKENKEVWIHNLKFDAEFILYYLLTHGFEYSKEPEENTFNCIISSQGAFYMLEVIFEKKNKKYNKVVFYDSHKKLPFKVDTIGKSFGLPYQKVEVDQEFYTRERPLDHIPTPEEIEYMEGDVKTVACALGIQFDQELTSMTIGGDSLSTYKKMLGGGDYKAGRKKFERDFPVLPLHIDDQLRDAYKGGYVYVKETKAGNPIKKGRVYDINSLYPWTMKECLLPYGLPMAYKGEYVHDEFYPLYVQRLKCSFTLKKDHLPTVQIKGFSRFVQTEYLKTSKDKLGRTDVDLVMTSVDLKLFFDHYDVDVWEWQGGFKFKGAVGMFDEYIERFMAMKIENDDNPALRSLAKLLLNNLYGKFGKHPDVTGKYPVLNDKGTISYKLLDEDIDKPVYIPLASFITAYAREKTIRTAQKCLRPLYLCGYG